VKEALVDALGVGEAALRFKNADMRNYDIEMWRYALELKKRADEAARYVDAARLGIEGYNDIRVKLDAPHRIDVAYTGVVPLVCQAQLKLL